MRKASCALILAMCLLIGIPIEYQSKASPAIFSEQELQFIKEHPIINVGVDPDFVPFEFIDSDGKYKGIAADYIKLIEIRSGLEFQITNNASWEEAYTKAINKQIDILPAISETQERRNYFLFSEPYYSYKRAIFFRSDEKEIRGIEDIKNKKVAVQQASSNHSYLLEYPEIKLSLYDKPLDAIKAVSQGKELAFVGNMVTTSYYIKENGFGNLKYIEIDETTPQSIHFAIRKDWPILQSIINKSLKDITKNEKIGIYNKWMGIESDRDYSEILRLFAIAAAIGAIVLGISLYWVYRLKKEVEAREILENETRKAKEEAEAANHIKSIFLARMSHEIRTPLNAITGLSYLLGKTEINLTQRIYLEKIIQSSKNMLGIINDILDFSKIEAGKIELEQRPFNLDKLIQQIMSIVYYKIEEQEIEFFVNKDPNIPSHYFGDPLRIEQILINIINNALKFTSLGEVSFNIRLLEKNENMATLEFLVKDTGIGMSKEQQESLFKPFEQGDSSITRVYGGTGLGLSIVKSLIEMMQGSVKVFSEKGEGSAFYITIPLEIDIEKEQEQAEKGLPKYFEKLRILVLEKNSNYIRLLEEYLRSFGITGEFTRSDEKAVKAINNNNFDICIVDFDTPAEGGIDFINNVKETTEAEKLPKFILMVPLIKEELLEKLEKTNVDIGITKPIVPSALNDAIMEALQERIVEKTEKEKHYENKKAKVEEGKYKVLVIDDNNTNQYIASSILENIGVKVILASNGKEGYEYYMQHKKEISLILMDLHMPVMDGYQSASLIRAEDKEIPIVAMTADAIVGVKEKCEEAGIEGYITKPYEPEEFIDTVIKILEAKTSTAAEGFGKTNIEDNNKDATSIEQANSEADTIMESKEKNREDILIIPFEKKEALDYEDGLKRIGGNKELYQVVIEAFLKDSEEVIDILSNYINTKDYERAEAVAHKIKGGAGNIGAKLLFEAAKRLQKALEVKQEELINEEMKVFSKEYTKLSEEIKKY